MSDKRSQPDFDPAAEAPGSIPMKGWPSGGGRVDPIVAAQMDAAGKTRPAEGPSPEWIKRIVRKAGS